MTARYDGVSLTSGDAIASVGSNILRMEGRHNIRLRNARRFQLVSDAVFRAITLDPYFVIDDVQMNETVMYTSNVAFPAHRHNEVAAVRFIEYRFVGNIHSRVSPLGKRHKNFPYDLLIMRYFIHRSISSGSTSNTINRESLWSSIQAHRHHEVGRKWEVPTIV